MKRFFLATIGLLGLGSSLPVIATTYTHNLIYTVKPGDNSGSLSGQITFDDSDSNKDDNFTAPFNNFTAIDRGLITNITFTYILHYSWVIPTKFVYDIKLWKNKSKLDTNQHK